MGRSITKSQARKVLELLSKGWSQRRISQVTGVSQAHVCHINLNKVNWIADR